jgi:hypothetical protein
MRLPLNNDSIPSLPREKMGRRAASETGKHPKLSLDILVYRPCGLDRSSRFEMF